MPPPGSSHRWWGRQWWGGSSPIPFPRGSSPLAGEPGQDASLQDTPCGLAGTRTDTQDDKGCNAFVLNTTSIPSSGDRARCKALQSLKTITPFLGSQPTFPGHSAMYLPEGLNLCALELQGSNTAGLFSHDTDPFKLNHFRITLAKAIPSPTSPSPFTTSKSRKAPSFRVGSLSTWDKRSSSPLTSGIAKTCSSQQYGIPRWWLGNLPSGQGLLVQRFLLRAYQITPQCGHPGWAIGSRHPLQQLLCFPCPSASPRGSPPHPC